MPEVNLRFRLRGFEEPNACRLSSILLGLTVDTDRATRDNVAARWAVQYPRHAAQTGKTSVRSRITRSLPVLRAAGIAQAEQQDIVVINRKLLEMSAGNLALVEANGEALPPSLWISRPQVPEDLLAEQERLMQRPAQPHNF